MLRFTTAGESHTDLRSYLSSKGMVAGLPLLAADVDTSSLHAGSRGMDGAGA